MIGTNSSTMGYLAECLCALETFDEVEEWVERSRRSTDEYDIESHLAWRKPEALLRAREGDHAGADAVAREALRLADDTDDPTAQADARIVLAETVRLAGRSEDAIGVFRAAIDLFEAKGNVLGAAHAHERLDALREPLTS